MDLKRLASILFGSEEAREKARMMIRKVVEEGSEEMKTMSSIKTRTMTRSSSYEYRERKRIWSSGKVLDVKRGPTNICCPKA